MTTEQSASAAPLAKRGDSFATDEPAGWAARRERQQLQVHAKNLLSGPNGGRSPAVCLCQTAQASEGEVELLRRPNGASVSGVFRCKSAICPVCSISQSMIRAEKVGKVVEKAVDDFDGIVLFGTINVRHRLHDRLSELRDGVSNAFRRVRRRRDWRARCEAIECVGAIVAPEVTWGDRFGWNYHEHFALVLKFGGRTEEERAIALEFGRWVIETYLQTLRRMGYSGVWAAQDIKIAWTAGEAVEYLTKSVKDELAGAGLKGSKGALSLSVWDLLRRSADPSLSFAERQRYGALFVEFATVFKGVVSCRVSAQIKAALGISDDDGKTSDEAEPPADSGEVIGAVIGATWNRLLGRGHVAAVFALVDSGADWEAIKAKIDVWAAPPPPRDPPVEKPDACTVARRARSYATSARDAVGLIERVLADMSASARRRGYAFRPPPIHEIAKALTAL